MGRHGVSGVCSAIFLRKQMRLRLTTEPSLIILKVCGSNSVVRVPAFQAGCRGFESHLPLHFLNYEKRCSQSGVARLGERIAKSPYRQRTEKYCRHCWARDGKDSDVAGQSASIDLPQRTQSVSTDYNLIFFQGVGETAEATRRLRTPNKITMSF